MLSLRKYLIDRRQGRRRGERQGSPAPKRTWQDPAFITAIAAFLAAMIPVTAFINGWYDLKLEREKYLTELRLQYADRAIDKSRDPEDRERFLRFLVETTNASDPLQRWARNELKRADDIRRIQHQMAELDQKLHETTGQLANIQKLHSRAEAAATSQKQNLSRQLEKAILERKRLAEELSTAERKMGRPESELEANEPIIHSVELLSSSEGARISSFRIAGDHFGKSPGHILITPHRKPPILINPIQWSDSEVQFVSPDVQDLAPNSELSILLSASNGKLAKYLYRIPAVFPTPLAYQVISDAALMLPNFESSRRSWAQKLLYGCL